MNEKCLECEKFDQETKAKMCEIFSQDELTLGVIVFSNAVKMQSQAVGTIPFHDLRRLQMQRDIDFAGAMMGKFVVALETEASDKIKKGLRRLGIEIQVRHQECPHKSKDEQESEPKEAQKEQVGSL